MGRAIPFILLATLAFTLAGDRAVVAEDRTIADLKVGAYWHGPDLTGKDLAGKVVLVWLWGK